MNDEYVVSRSDAEADPLQQMPPEVTAIWRPERNETVIVCHACPFIHTIAIPEAMRHAINATMARHEEQHAAWKERARRLAMER